MLSYRISVPGPTFDNFSPIFFFFFVFLPTRNAKSYSLTVTVLVILLQEIIYMVMHGDNECLSLLVPACARVKYSSKELSMLLCEPAKQMRSSMSVKYVCVCVCVCAHTPTKGSVHADRNTFKLLSPVCFTSGEVPAAQQSRSVLALCLFTREETHTMAAMGKQVRSDKETFSGNRVRGV